MTTPATFGLSRIGQIAVRVRDLDRAVAFYRDTLGMRFLFKAPPGLAFFDCNGVRLLLDAPQDAAFDHPASVIYYSVPEIRVAHEILLARGVRFLRATSDREPGQRRGMDGLLQGSGRERAGLDVRSARWGPDGVRLVPSPGARYAAPTSGASTP
jgi:catechol 2,3-dioxygenase-like lactoylglutathione lyase family enzyme